MSKKLFVAAASLILMSYLVSLNTREESQQQASNKQSELSICLSKYDNAAWTRIGGENFRYQISQEGQVQKIYVSNDRLYCYDYASNVDECDHMYIGNREGKCGFIAKIENNRLVNYYPRTEDSSDMVRVVFARKRWFH